MKPLRHNITTKSSVHDRRAQAFTRMELVAVLMSVAVLALVAVPALAGLGSRSGQVQCVSNLKRIGQAFHIWGMEHDNYQPFRVLQSQGGTMVDGDYKVAAVWFEFAWISNELVTPKILACPSDEGTPRVARDFSTNPDGGLLNFNYRNNAVSYILGTDVFPYTPGMLLAGDRNMAMDGQNLRCSARILNVARISSISSNVRWTNGIHRFSGNLLFDDGRVQETTSRELRLLVPGEDGTGADHFIIPK